MEFGIIEDYAIRMVLLLSANPDRIITRREISKKMQIPLSVIAKIGQILEARGILEVYRGKGGGYKLKKNPKDITMLDVLESFTGKIALNKCVDNSGFCSLEKNCPVHKTWIEINEKFRDLLKINFEDLLMKYNNREV